MKLSAQQKLTAIQSLKKDQRSVTEIAKELGVARKTIYSWIRQYARTSNRVKAAAFQSRYLKANQHPKALAYKYRHQLIRLIHQHPDWGCRKFSQHLKAQGINLGYFAVHTLLKELQAETPTVRKTLKNNWAGPGRLNAYAKAQILEQLLTHKKSITQLSRDYSIARKTIYQWQKKYQVGITEGKEANESLVDHYMVAENHPRAIYHRIQPQLLESIIADPKLSVHELAKVVGVSNFTVWQILNRYNLRRYEDRVYYANKFGPTISEAPVLSQTVDTISLPSLDQLSPNVLPGPPPPAPTQFRLRPSLGFGASFLLSFTCVSLLIQISDAFYSAHSVVEILGIATALVALTVGGFFFLYSLKYYFSIAYVLLISRKFSQGNQDSLAEMNRRTGMLVNVSSINLDRQPFVSIHIPLYNEKRVVNRLLEAVTSIEYEHYEVIVCDDSTDETKDIIAEWKNHPRVKISHRDNRIGFKGAALEAGRKLMDPQTEFVIVFDADFLPYPDTIQQFLKYFKAATGTLDPGGREKGKGESYTSSNIAAIQGYQWHVLNKSENWITRGVRTEYAGSYVIERSGAEVYGGLKQIAGSVFMIRADVLNHYGWKNSITEDFQLTLRLYRDGFKVLYTPYIQAPSECVSTLKRLVRQRMRWAEGHSHNIKLLFKDLLVSKNVSFAEKFEFGYLAPYYLQSALFLIGTFAWFVSETIFRVKLPFWTAIWGWSLVLTNLLSLPLMNTVGLFLEESEEKDYAGIFSFVLLSYILAPFQAYASVKGFLEREEGPWFRTPKTGKITDTYRRGRFYDWIKGLFGKPVVAPSKEIQLNTLRYLDFTTANNQFNRFDVKKRIRHLVGNLTFTFLIFVTICVLAFSPLVPLSSLKKADAAEKFMSVGDALTENHESNNKEEEIITTPRSVVIATGTEEKVEFIFHKEPRVRIKIKDKEVEVTTVEIPGLGKVNQKKTLMQGSRKVVYQEIFPHIDLEYEIKGELEERFIIKERVDITEVIQSIKLTGLKVLTNADAYGFYDRDGNSVYALRTPYMYQQKESQLAENKNFDLRLSLSEQDTGYTLKKSLQKSAKDWLLSPQRVYPVVLDPGTIVSSGLTDAEAGYGAFQRKVYYVASINKYYAIEDDGLSVNYHYCDADVNNCTSGSNWSAAVALTADADNSRPSLWWDGTVIWVAWGDNSLDAIEFRSITPVNGQTNDTLGTATCVTGDILSANGTFTTEADVGIAVAGNGTAGVVYTDEDGGGNDFDTFTMPAASCSSNPTYSASTGTMGANAHDRVAVAPNDTSSNTFTAVWQDSGASTGIQANELTGSAWGTEFTIENIEGGQISVTADSSGNLWIFHATADGSGADLYKCATQCDTGTDVTIQTDPWSSATNLDDVTITYISTGNDLKLSVLKDGTATTQKAYFKAWDIDTTSLLNGDIATGNGSDYGWAAGDLDMISSPYSVSDGSKAAVVVGVGGATYEFATVPENLSVFIFILPFIVWYIISQRKKLHYG